MIKSFLVLKNKSNENVKAPTHSLTANIGSHENPQWVTLGAGWVKEGKNGKFVSCLLQDEYVDHTDSTKTRKGYKIVDEVAVRDNETGEKIPDNLPEVNMEDMSF